MPPKATKNEQKQREKVAVDKTFGMKNKNKSKVVQKYIKNITQNVKVGGGGKTDEQERKAKDDKQKELAQKALMNSLFNMGTDKKGRAFDPNAKKMAKQQEEEAIAAGKKLNEEVRKEIIEGIANTIRLTNPKGIRMSELGGHQIIGALKEKHADTFKILSMLLFIKANEKVFWVNDPDDNNPIIRCKEDVDAEVEPDDRPIEEIIEERRRALPPGGTMVTEVSFKAWKEKREADRLAKVEQDRKAAMSKKGASKGAGLSGKDLFHFDASLFVDDDGAVSADEYDERAEDPPDSDAEDGKPAAKATAADDDDASEDEEAQPEDRGGDEEDAGDEGAASSSAAASSAAPSGDRWASSRKDADSKKDAAAASGDGKEAVAINKDLFMEEEELPDFDDED